MQWLQNPNHSNVVNLNNVRREASRHFRNKKKKYLKAKTDEIGTKRKIKINIDLYRDITDFKKGYQLKTNIAKVEKGDLVTDSQRILASWRNHFSLLLNIHRVRNARQTNTYSIATSAWAQCLWVWGG